MIKNGVVYSLGVVVDLIPPSNTNRPQNKMDAESITIHETGNTSKGANAKAHSNYVKNTSTKSSWHFTVDSENIYQHLPINENGWHAGDGGNGKGNRTSIAIEICINSDGDFEKAKEKAKELVQFLMSETSIKDIYPHKHWSGKDCPHNILKSGWNEFVNFLHAGFKDDEDYETVKAQRDYYKEKFNDLFEWITELKEYGGY